MNRMDLEDAIMKIDLNNDLFTHILNNTDFNDDRLINLLLGVKELYKFYYEQLWDTFKQVYKLDEYRDSTD